MRDNVAHRPFEPRARGPRARDAVRRGGDAGFIKQNPVRDAVAAVSVGIVKGKLKLDLDYELDSTADVDMNVAMTGAGQFVELQGTAEGRSFSADELQKMLALAKRGIRQIFTAQTKALQACLR